ncbi:MAG TPA: hypothetical protein VLH61_06750, partial [Bacteroidales bacterium]|nr:hypothetical protein [Bacteroidales bacterium]
MQAPVKIVLKPGKDASLRRFHPWVFSGAIKSKPDGLEDGAVVEVFSCSNEYLGTGIYQDATIAVRLMAFPPERPLVLDEAFWTKKLEKAYLLRKTAGLAENRHTNVYRLVHGEGDHLPGIIIDHYDGHLVIQVHAAGNHAFIGAIARGLENIYGSRLKSITDKSRETLP